MINLTNTDKTQGGAYKPHLKVLLDSGGAYIPHTLKVNLLIRLTTIELLKY